MKSILKGTHERLPSTAGKLAINATNAGGVDFRISSSAFAGLLPAIATLGFDRVPEMEGMTGAVVLGRTPLPAVKQRRGPE